MPSTSSGSERLNGTLSRAIGSFMVKNAIYAQSGGVTAVINASACGVIETTRRHKDKIGKLYAAANGIIGALCEELVDTSEESNEAISALRHTPGGAFGSCRYKLKEPVFDTREYERLIEVFKAHDIGYFFYNGGGDSADTCHKISKFSEKAGYPIQAIHIPKTIDNDLPFMDTCPGFGSVAKYVAVSTRETAFDVRAMSHTSTKVFVFEVMGRHTGWIAAAGALAADERTDLPIMILVPELPFETHRFMAKVTEMMARYGYCVIVASEGLQDTDGRFIADQGTHDAFGHTQLGGVAPVIADLVKSKLGHKSHWAVADYLQRAARHLASSIDTSQAYEVGKAAVEMAIAGDTDIMVSIVRTSSNPYTWEMGRVPLAQVANVERRLPQGFISSDGFGITPTCREYILPLLRGEDYPPYENGLPNYVTLKNERIPQCLAPFQL